MRNDLKNARVAAGLTQQQLADAIGKDQGTVSRYENGTTEPDKDVALALATALNLSVLQVLYPNQSILAKPSRKHAEQRVG